MYFRFILFYRSDKGPMSLTQSLYNPFHLSVHDYSHGWNCQKRFANVAEYTEIAWNIPQKCIKG